MLTSTELRQHSETSASRTSLAIAFDWALIAAAFALAARFPHPLVWLGCAVLLGRQQLALAILMHDGAHRRLFRSFRVNDFFGQTLLAAPVFFSLFTYRRTHLKHHRAPLAEDDPDLRLIGGYPISRGSLARKLARDLFGVSYFKFVGHFVRLGFGPRPVRATPSTERPARPTSDEARGAWPAWAVALSILVAQGAVFAVLWASGHPGLYALWLVSMMTVLQVLLRVRGIAEHAGFERAEDQRLCTRTVVNPVQTFFFAPHRVNFHVEHHLYPSVPAYLLPAVHRLLRERGDLPEAQVHAGYGSVLREVTRR